MSVDWLNWPAEDTNYKMKTKVVLVWVGIGGCSDRAYIKYLVDYLCRSEDNIDTRYICGVLHPRGAGNTEITTPLLFDFLRMQDWRDSIDFCVRKLDSEKCLKGSYNLYGCGISIGANNLLNYCALKGKASEFRGIISFNNPWDLQLAMSLMKGSIFERFMV